HLGVADDGPERTRAAILHILSEAERGGSTCVPLEVLLPTARELLGSGSVSVEEIDVYALVDAGGLVRDETWIYRTETAELEAELARRIDDLLAGEPAERLHDPGEATSEDGLTEEQSHGVRNAFVHRLSVITGGPGTGKTASIRTIAKLAAGQG